MSYTSLWIVDKKWSGKEFTTYHNSHLFPPVVWDILMCKYIKPEERNLGLISITSFLAWMLCGASKEEMNRRSRMLNERINSSEIQYDRVLWELCSLSVFNAKDKDFVAECIERFVENNLDRSPKYKDYDDIKSRFFEVAKDIRNLPKRVKFFVIHPNSVDDNVEWWFCGKRLCSWDKFVCEFTLIEDGKVVGFSDNLTMCKEV